MEFLAYGYPFPPIKTRLDQLEEGAQIIRSMLHNESTTFHGDHFSVDNAYPIPPPHPAPTPDSGSAASAKSAPYESPPATPTAGTPLT